MPNFLVGFPSGSLQRYRNRPARVVDPWTLLLLVGIRSAERRPVDCPVDGADKAGTAHDIAERYRYEIMDDAGDSDGRSVEIRWNVAGLDQQPRQGQKVHVG